MANSNIQYRRVEISFNDYSPLHSLGLEGNSYQMDHNGNGGLSYSNNALAIKGDYLELAFIIKKAGTTGTDKTLSVSVYDQAGNPPAKATEYDGQYVNDTISIGPESYKI